MRLIKLDLQPLHEILFENAGPRRQGPETRTLALVRAVVESLPSKLDAILVTGDLQRNVLTEEQSRSAVWALQIAGHGMTHDLPRVAAELAGASRKLRGLD